MGIITARENNGSGLYCGVTIVLPGVVGYWGGGEVEWRGKGNAWRMVRVGRREKVVREIERERGMSMYV